MTNGSRSRGVVFDFDGTLFDSVLGIYRSMCGVFNACHICPPSYADYQRNFRAPYRLFYEERGVLMDERGIGETFNGAFDKMRPNLKLFPDAEGTVRALNDGGVILGLVSGQRREVIEEKCLPAGILPCFRTFNAGTEQKEEAVKNFCRTHGLDPESVWLIGDFASDMETARGSGVRPIGIARGNPELRAILLAAGAIACVDALKELPALIA